MPRRRGCAHWPATPRRESGFLGWLDRVLGVLTAGACTPRRPSSSSPCCRVPATACWRCSASGALFGALPDSTGTAAVGLGLALGADRRRACSPRPCISAGPSGRGGPSANGARPGCRARASRPSSTFVPAGAARSAGCSRRRTGASAPVGLGAGALRRRHRALHRDDLRVAEADRPLAYPPGVPVSISRFALLTGAAWPWRCWPLLRAALRPPLVRRRARRSLAWVLEALYWRRTDGPAARRHAGHRHRAGRTRPRAAPRAAACRARTTSCARWVFGSPASTRRSSAASRSSSGSHCRHCCCSPRSWPAAPVAAAALRGLLAPCLGMLIERWLFFAEARHTVTLYYGAEQA